MRYRLIAIDLDGTLLSPEGGVSFANRDAIAQAHDAGVLVVPCTGRAWHESHFAIDGIPGLDRGVFVTGALVNDIATGRTLESRHFPDDIASQLVAIIADLPEAVLVFRDRDRVGHDYLVTGEGELVDNTRWWFEHTNARVRVQRDLDDWRHCCRVAVVSRNRPLHDVEARLTRQLGEHIISHCFGGIPRQEENETVQVMEVFPAGVDKWRGVCAVAEHHGIPLDQVATIGDEVNDVSMLRSAACGIAMGNAVEVAALAADHRTRSNTEDGVAYAIDQMLVGAW